MEGFTVAVILGIYLCAASSVVQGVSVSCAMAYDEGGAPAVFQSPECPEWVLSMKSHQNQTGNCQFSTLQGHRAYQEDRVTCNLDMKIPFSGRDGHKEVTIGVAAVFDGHGGEQASEMASKIILDYFFLHSVFNAYKQAVSYKDKHDLVSQDHNDCEAGDHIMNLRRELLLNDCEAGDHIMNLRSSQGALLAISNESLHGILKEALLRTINDIDSKFSLEAFNNGYVSGSTAAVAVLVDDQILVAFVGDSKALICSDSIQFHPDVEGILVTERYVRELTRDHHPDRADERSRIEAAGGFVSFHDVPRVNGILAMSRAIGDVYLKRYGVIGIPEVIGWQRLTTSDTYLVIASDGIFESLSPQNVCDMLGDANEMLSKEESSSSLADFIVKAAFNKGSTDNLSAIVVPLRHH